MQKLQEEKSADVNGVKENQTLEYKDMKMDLWNTKIEMTKLKKENEKLRLKVK